MSGPILTYGSEAAPQQRTSVRVLGWLAIACGALYWATVFVTRVLRYRIPATWAVIVLSLFAIGSVLGVVGTIRSRGRSGVAWIGLILNMAVLVSATVFAYTRQQSRKAVPRNSQPKAIVIPTQHYP
jgi:uncharacterized membrane protein